MAQYVGGYYTIPAKLVKTGLHKHTARLSDPVSNEMLAALNIVQRTRWAINPFILDVMSSAHANGDRIGGLPPIEDDLLPARVPEKQWDDMGPSERMAHKVAVAAVHGSNARLQGKREELKRKLELARELRNEPAIWFPHALDFRGRVYPIPQDLGPQGDDVSKALLMFADAKPLGERGFYWLRIALANAAGQDKMTFDERIGWVEDNANRILACAAHPLTGSRWWAQQDESGKPAFDSPWCFLALAREYAGAVMTLSPFEYESRLPINIDATCSGIQHLSAMGRDHVGARATNLMDTGSRQDLYNEVAEAVKGIISREAVRGVIEAHNWIGHVTRSTVKRAVMTTPYGVTPMGIRDQLIADGHTANLPGSQVLNANFLRDSILEAMDTTMVASRRIMNYIKAVAATLTEAGIPLTWVTPAGMVIQQSYYGMRNHRVTTLYGRLQLWDEDTELGLDRVKNPQSAAPNFVHSFDAAHLALTVIAAALRHGIRHFSLIHDSYGAHACDIDALGRTLREMFVDIYTEDQLERFAGSVADYAGDIELPPLPAQGDFAVQKVLDSPYFFS